KYDDMHHRGVAKLWSKLTKPSIKCVPSIDGLFEGRPLDFWRAPMVIFECDPIVRFHLNTKDSRIRDDDQEIDLRSKTPIPRSQIQRMQCDPVVGAAGKH